MSDFNKARTQNGLSMREVLCCVSQEDERRQLTSKDLKSFIIFPPFFICFCPVGTAYCFPLQATQSGDFSDTVFISSLSSYLIYSYSPMLINTLISPTHNSLLFLVLTRYLPCLPFFSYPSTSLSLFSALYFLPVYSLFISLFSSKFCPLYSFF